MAFLAAFLTLTGLLSAPTVTTAQFIDAAMSNSNTIATGTLAPPTGVSATSGDKITVSWTATTSTNASGYYIYRSGTSGVLGPRVATVTPRTTTSWVDNAPLDGNNYYVVKSFMQNWESGTTESVGTKPVFIEDNFNSSGAMGNTEVGAKPWQEINGTWSRNGSGFATTTTGISQNPMMVVNMASPNVDLRVSLNDRSGEAAYFRVVDGNDWFRARYRRYDYTYQYYVTEYQHTTYTTEYEYQTYATEYEYKMGYTEYEYYNYWWSYEHEYGVWGAWYVWGEKCRSFGLPANESEREYRWGTNKGTKCDGGKSTMYNVEARDMSISYPWYLEGETCPAGYARCRKTGNSRTNTNYATYWDTSKRESIDQETGNSRFVQTGTCWSTTSCGSGQTTGNSRTYATGTYYWSSTGKKQSIDQATGASRQVASGTYWSTTYCAGCPTRQAGPYTASATDYYVVVERSVNGTITNLFTSGNVGSISNLRVVLSGSTINVYSNTTNLLTTLTDTNHATATRHGLGLGGTDSASPTNRLTYVWCQGL